VVPIAAGGVVLVIAAVIAIAARSNATSAGHPTASQMSGPTAPATGASDDTTPAPSKLGPPAGWQLTFSSDFTGTSLDTSAYGTCYPWAPSGCTNFGNSGEKEWYQPSQDQVNGGQLHLVAELTPTVGHTKGGYPKDYMCRSGMVTTYPSFHFTYGYIQVTARIPYGKGLWSAFWLGAYNEQWPPEVDMLEHWGDAETSKAYLHPVGSPVLGGPFSAPGINKGWHTFALSWTPKKLTWIVDGRQVQSSKFGVPQQPMYFIANLADYDITPGGCTGSLDIKSIKVWQQPA
jgi:beta-glucanase (GH16 family)